MGYLSDRRAAKDRRIEDIRYGNGIDDSGPYENLWYDWRRRERILDMPLRRAIPEVWKWLSTFSFAVLVVGLPAISLVFGGYLLFR